MRRQRWVWCTVLWWGVASSVWASTRTITVTGTVDDPKAIVKVNGTTATISSGTFSATVTLSEGSNTVTATATDPAGNTASSSVTVALDTMPPVIKISAPTDGQVFGAGP